VTVRASRGVDVVLYDGVCALCNWLVRFILRNETGPHFRFAPLQSEWAQRVLRTHGRSPERLDSVIVVEDAGGRSERLLTAAPATACIARTLRRPWPFFALLAALPAPLVDGAYAFIARRRYRLFGRYEACAAPPAGVGSRFLDRAESAAPVGAPSTSTRPAGGPW
jgi:predicted DCC family thiol-disulfide oxidoreductase YuxK